MIYFTYGEPPSGVYSGQVCDVVNHLNASFNADIRLVAFISLQQFRANKKKIKNECSNAIVFPMLPKAEYWRVNSIWLWLICLFYSPYAIIARNVIACNMAIAVKSYSSVKKVCFDGRGAIAAEWKEYDVKVYDSWKAEIDELEKNAVMKSDFRIAVSNQLVNYWKIQYGYDALSHVVIPCTVSRQVNKTAVPQSDIRIKMGYAENDVLFAYSGSTAGWQSFRLLHNFLQILLKQSPFNKVLFLAKSDENIEKLKKEFPQQVHHKWLAHNEVIEVLSGCDYGILVREETVTNRVASPTKFAEYLSAGLPVIISDNLGDYSSFVELNQCGIRMNGTLKHEFTRPDDGERERLMSLVQQHFTKEACSGQYAQLVRELSA